MLSPSPPTMFGIFERSLTRRLASTGIAISFRVVGCPERRACERNSSDAEAEPALARRRGSVAEVVAQVEGDQRDPPLARAVDDDANSRRHLVGTELEAGRKERGGERPSAAATGSRASASRAR